MRRYLLLLVLLALPLLVGCPVDCKQLRDVLALAKASGNPAAIQAAEKALAAAKCAVPTAPPPATCPDGLPPFEGKCPTVCADLACEYGCEQTPAGAFCKPKPAEWCPAGQTWCSLQGGGCLPDGVACGPVAAPVEPPPVTPPVEAPLIRDEDLTHVGDAAPSKVWADANAAINRWRTAHPEKWRDDGACLIDGPAGIDAAFLGISTELLRVGIVAGQSIADGGQRSDCTFVNRTGTNLYEEGHLFDYARACVATGPNAMKGLYRRGEAPPVTPPPVTPPPSTSACPAEPCPDRARWKFNAHTYPPHKVDTTPVTVGQEPYCRAVGLSPMADGTLRAACPMRVDGHPDRRLVEEWLLGGIPVTDARNGAACAQVEGNPFQFYASPDCRLCNPARTVCTTWGGQQ